MLNSGLTELSAALALRKISSRELTQGFIERIARLNGALNAFITVDEEGALAAARRADERLARRNGAPLTGIPLAYKDIYCTKGLRTTCASYGLTKFSSIREPQVVRSPLVQ